MKAACTSLMYCAESHISSWHIWWLVAVAVAVAVGGGGGGVSYGGARHLNK